MKNLQKGFIAPLLIAIIIILITGGGYYIYSQQDKLKTPVSLPLDNKNITVAPKPIPALSFNPDFASLKCEKEITFIQDQTKKVIVGKREYDIVPHTESEDDWASFTINNSKGEIGRYYDASFGNPLVAGGKKSDREGKIFDMDNTIVIKGLSLTLKKVGYTSSGQEFADVCLNPAQ